MLLPRLAISDFRHHRVRTALTVAAIALAVSLVVSVNTGYASLRQAVLGFLNQYIGAIDVFVRPTQDARGIDPRVLRELAADREVAVAIPRLDTQFQMTPEEAPPFGKMAQVKGIRRPDDREVDKLPLLAGRWFEGDSGDVAVVDQAAAEVFGIKQGEGFELGRTFTMPGLDRKLTLRVVGVVRKPAFLAHANPTIYVPLRTLQGFVHPERPGLVNRVLIILRTGVDAEAFARRWQDRLAAIDPGLRLRLASDTRIEFAKNMQGLEVLSYLGGSVAMLAATFIVFSSLSMGVVERSRTLAMLRAVGALRGQLARLVLLEGLLLSLAGVAIGVPLGLLWVKLLALRFPLFFASGITIGWGGIAFGSAGAILAALAASLLPAWMATRADPLAAMAPLAAARPDRFPLRATLAGLALAVIDGLLLLGPFDAAAAALGLAPESIRTAKFFGHFFLGIPCLMLGFFLLAPAFVWLVERLIGPVVAMVLGLRFALLRQQLTGGIWRAAGTAAALMVGLAVLVVMQTQGNTMLGGWRLPTRFPDIFISAPPAQALDEADIARLRQVPGIRPGEVMPLAMASPRFGSGFMAVVALSMFPDATMFFGIDPDAAFRLMELDFRDDQGNRVSPERRAQLEAQARDMLKKGRHLIITEELRALKGLKVGDRFPLQTSHSGEVEYTVAGIVWSPGLDVIVGMYDLDRTFEQRTASSVFGTLEDARRDFGVEQYHLFVANLEYGVEREQILARVKEAVGKWGLLAYDIRHIKYTIESTFRQLLLLMSTVALAAMAVASLGVTNTVMASVRSRRWQFGVLRSIGVTRWQLLRLVMAEATLLGLVGAALGVTAGLTMSVNAKAFAAGILGYNPPLDVPWGMVLGGSMIVMAIALLASLWPAIHVARAQPLTLLQAGRAAA